MRAGIRDGVVADLRTGQRLRDAAQTSAECSLWARPNDSGGVQNVRIGLCE